MAKARVRSRYGFFPAAGTDYTRGSEPEIARRLGNLGRTLKLHLIGISGYRTPAHSVSVGGFADDPHTQGAASDTPGVEGVPEATLRRFGLTRPFPGAQEADHIQLFRARGGTASASHPPRSGPSYTLAEYWTQGGGRPNLAPIMAAIGMAESGGRIDAVGGPNSDGTYDYGWLQINSSHGYDRDRLLSDPVYTARAGAAIERSQGLGAWTTYRSGAFRAFMGSGRNFVPRNPGVTRPGGAGSDSSDEAVSTEFASYTQDAGWHWEPWKPFYTGPHGKHTPFGLPLPDPLDTFGGSAKAVKDAGSFLKWIAWIFHPKNVLRAVEFVTGLTLMGFGLQSLYAVYRDSPQTSAVARTGQAAGGAVRTAAAATPPGRAVRTASAARYGKRAARAETRAVERQGTVRRSKAKERKRQGQKGQKRDVRRARFSREDVPF